MFINLSFNNPKSENIFNDLFTTQIDRGVELGAYNSYFCRYLGVENIESYNNNLAFLNENKNEFIKILNLPLSKNFNKSLTIDIEGKIILYKENFYKYIDLFLENSLKLRFYKTIDFIKETLEKERITNDKIIEILRFIVLNSELLIKNSNWNEINNMKYIFYGTAILEEAYLMLFLKLLGSDVLYLNPSGSDIEIFIRDLNNYSFKVVGNNNFENLTYEERAKLGRIVLEYRTVGKEASKELNETMFNDETGFYRPWQLVNCYSQSVLINSTFDEIMLYYNEKTTVRPGFKVSNNVVSIPNFFAVIIGISNDKESFGEFVRTIFNRDNALVLDNIAIYNYPIAYNETLEYKECFNELGELTIQRINYNIAGNRFKNYREDLKRLFVNKINEILKSSYMMNERFTKRDKLEYVATIMTMPEEFYQLIDSFDFTDKIPKLTIYRDNNQSLSIREIYVLTFLNSIGLDIILYSSFGAYGIEQWINKNFVTYHRLDKIEHNFNIDEAMKFYKKRSFFSKLFKR